MIMIVHEPTEKLIYGTKDIDELLYVSGVCIPNYPVPVKYLESWNVSELPNWLWINGYMPTYLWVVLV